MLSRVLRSTRAAVSFTFPAAPTGDVAVAIEHEDGTALRTESVTPDGDTATLTLTAADTAALDLLRFEWTATLDGEAQVFESWVEVVGGFLFSVADLRKLAPFRPEDGEDYTDADLEAARTAAEAALEDACGVAFVPRYARERLDGAPRGDLLLGHPRVLAVRSVTVNGAALDADALALVEPLAEGTLYRPAGWSCGRRAVEVVYEHGHRFTPPRVSRAAMLLARHVLVESPLDDRASSVTNSDGTFQVFVTAGVRGAVFSLPEANAVVEAYGYPTDGVA
jgi:hypothetical protein